MLRRGRHRTAPACRSGRRGSRGDGGAVGGGRAAGGRAACSATGRPAGRCGTRSSTCTTAGWPTCSPRPPARTRTSPWSPSAARPPRARAGLATWTWSCCTAAAPDVEGRRRRGLVPGLGRRRRPRPLGPHRRPRRSRSPGTTSRPRSACSTLRHLAGDPALSAELREARVRGLAAVGARAGCPSCAQPRRARWRTAGELAFLLEPDLKEARGGLRDVHALHALAAARLLDLPGPAVAAARDVLLDVRDALHRRAGRALDRLVQQEQAAVAAAARPGRRRTTCCARSPTPAGRSRTPPTRAWRQVEGELAARRRTSALTRVLPGRRAPSPQRRPLADGVVEQDGEVVLARDADPWADPVLVLRAAARRRPGRTCRWPRTRWTGWRPSPRRCRRRGRPPPGTRSSTCSAPATRAVPVLEALDQAGLLVRLIPEWARVRSHAAAQPGAPLHRRPAPDGGRGRGRRADPRPWPGRTCCCSARSCTTSARAAPATTPTPGSRWCASSARASASRTGTRPRSWRWSATTCCCRTPRPGATWTTR